MFRQVRIHPEDSDYQRILWRQTPEQPVEDYRLLTVTYRTTSAPFLAIRTIQQLARDECEEFPTASRVVMSDFYVDDLLTGVSSKQEGEELIKQMKSLMSKGGFEIRKSKSNCHELVSQMDETETGLGVAASKITKRDILSKIARIFDPMGFLSPLTVALKIYNARTTKGKVELGRAHSRKMGNKVSLTATKTRVAPPPCKTCTLLRLELCATHLLPRLYRSIIDSIKLPLDEFHLWTDSQIALCWIKSDPKRWKKFISHRVMKIQQLTELKYWGHVSGKDNPADCEWRGLKPAALIKHELWWQGPSWLKDDCVDQIWEISNSDLQIQKQEEVVAFCHLQTTSAPEYFLKYSSFTKLKRVTAWCLRFGTNYQRESKGREYGCLTTAEMNRAIVLVQCSEFLHEIQSLNDRIQLPNKNRILDLGPFLEEGLLRVGGRIQGSNLSSSQKYPMILPKNHPITRLIIQEYHQRYLHAGPQLVLSLIRNKYWILGGRYIVKRVVKNCLICFKTQSSNNQEKSRIIMGDLPPDRINPSRPFLKTGIDITGPFDLKPSFIRSKSLIKSYVVLFACFAVKAIHLEIVTSLYELLYSSPKTIHFKKRKAGAQRILRDHFEIINATETRKFISEEIITWHFIPPSAPHFGGLWEANIKSVKGHLIRAGRTSLMNLDRALVESISDPNDIQALTPGHFLICASMIDIQEPTSADQINLTSRWSLVQKLRNSFWKRWSREYINSLRQKGKWRQNQSNLELDQLVLIKEDGIPPMRWRFGRIIEVFPGTDKMVRVALVRTAEVFRRPISSLYASRSELKFSGVFNLRCKQVRFIPPSLRIKDPVNNHFSREKIIEYRQSLLRMRIKGCHSSIRFFGKTIKQLIALIIDKIPIHELTDLIIRTTRAVREQDNSIHMKHEKTLQHWSKKYGCPYKNHSNQIVNLTETKLSEIEMDVLVKGLKFRMPNRTDNYLTKEL
ncbi:hypothetical protein LAZ67_22000737 [Cordylochernes scorpioides]|uniref:Integrase zinc-binding domain-containing protein n=1 Tax=Cordylochernes scorpioides TaxID=51811 RepID=A0ABY6LSD7_9ARAC|nr:hypothetical protein LAZ67_22000737 [Cordylochernes scorpioides]